MLAFGRAGADASMRALLSHSHQTPCVAPCPEETAVPPPIPSASDPGPPWQQAFDWIEANVGGRIRHYERQPRWRPAFYLDLERDGQTLPLYVRGARTEVPNNDVVLQFEHDVMVQLAKDGVPLPHIYGFCPEPAAIVMERSPGRENLATAQSQEEAETVLDEYIEILARIHALDTAPYEALGMEKPDTAAALGLADLPKWEATYRRSKSRPEPVIEFILSWLKRNVPEGRSRVSVLCGDSGQFLFEDGHLTTLIDLELALLGDPAADLAGMRGRDLSEPLGDLPRAFERYFDLCCERIPASVIDFHTIRFNLNTALATAPLVANPQPGIDLVQYLGWYWVWSRSCLEIMGHALGLDLPEVALPESSASRFSSANDALTKRLVNTSKKSTGHTAYELDAAARTSEYLRRAERHGPDLEREDIDEASNLVGRTLADWNEADLAVEELAMSAGPERDADLVTFCYRRCMRHEALLQPVLRELEGSRTQLLDG